MTAVGARVTERDVLDWLRRRYAVRSQGVGERYVFATHVRSHAGFDARTADAVAMDLWPSRGLELHGHEVKVSRSDWLAELRDPEKATAVGRYCDRWWLVVPDRQIVRDGELPDEWGLLIASSSSVRAAVKAPRRVAEPMTRTFIASLLRAAAKTARTATERFEEAP